MKKLLVILAVLVLLLTSCTVTRPADGDKLPIKDGNTTDIIADKDDESSAEVKKLSFTSYSCWANWTDDERIMQGIVNPDTVSHDYPRTHLPLYRIDSVESLEKFKTDYADVFSLDYNYDEDSSLYDNISDDTQLSPEDMIIEPYIAKGDLKPGDLYLLCSDGLTDMVSNFEICDILLRNEDPVDTVNELINTALDKGGKDNITVILCKVK